MRDLERTCAADDAIEACLARRMADHGRVRGLQLAMEEHGAHALEVWQRMQAIHALDLEEPEPRVACGASAGTTGGAMRHYRAHERPCEECRTAINHANQAARKRKEAAA